MPNFFKNNLELLVNQEFDGNWKKFSEYVGVSYNTIHSIKEGSAPRVDTVCQILSKTHVSSDWLLLGEGTQYKSGGIATTGKHARDFQDYPEIGTALVLDVVLFIDSWLSRNGKVMPADKKVEMIKALCKFLVVEDRKRPPAARETPEGNVIRMESFADFLKAASS